MAIEVDVEADVARVVRSSVTVKLPRDAAFRLFTERMGSWWPLATHSVFHAKAVAITIEPVVGGRVYEATADGRTSDWGTITEWQPGERLAMTWHPGDESDLATLVEVTFSEVPDGGTHVDLLHTGWAVHGAEAAARAADYQQGWTALLEGFAKAAGARPGSSLSAGSACLERLAVTGHDPIGGSQNSLAARLERGLVLGQRVHFRRAIGVPPGVDTGHHAVGGLDNDAQVLAGMPRAQHQPNAGADPMAVGSLTRRASRSK